MHQLEKTTPHFIRCIKPNAKQFPDQYEDDLVSQQLRCCGVLEVVRISRYGYPTRMTHQEFAGRYNKTQISQFSSFKVYISYHNPTCNLGMVSCIWRQMYLGIH
jgi:myosin heavy subunit